jgi:hypothetical protein
LAGLSSVIFAHGKPLILLGIIVQQSGQVLGFIEKMAVWGASRGNGGKAQLVNGMCGKWLILNGNPESSVYSAPSSVLAWGGGWCSAYIKKAFPGQTLFSNILFFQPELKDSKFFSGPVHEIF